MLQMSEFLPDRPKKIQRISQACDLCHRRSIRCRPSNESPSKCQNCYDFDVDCTYLRPSRRQRRNNSASSPSRPRIIGSHSDSQAYAQQEIAGTSSGKHGTSPVVSTTTVPQALPLHQLESRAYTPSFQHQGDLLTSIGNGQRDYEPDTLKIAWRSFASSSRHAIEHYLNVFIDLIYPSYPVFHLPTLWHDFSNRRHLEDDAFFASIMAACALAAVHCENGNFDGHVDDQAAISISSHIFFNAAQDTVLRRLPVAREMSYLRACLLLALTAVQCGRVQTMHLYIEHYFTLSARLRFYEEGSWPGNLSKSEKEERRCVFWSMYALDVGTSVTHGGTIRSQEVWSDVLYPSEIADDHLSQSVKRELPYAFWLAGWRCTIDLYRMLEHIAQKVRWINSSFADRGSVRHLVIADSLSVPQIMENVMSCYSEIPERFRKLQVQTTGNQSEDMNESQALNIQVVLSLIRTTLLSTSGPTNLTHFCGAVEHSLAIFQSAAPKFLRAMGALMIHHVEHMGRVLVSLVRSVIDPTTCYQVRTNLESMIALLTKLELNVRPHMASRSQLQAYVAELDRAQTTQGGAIPSTLLAAPGLQMIGANVNTSHHIPTETISHTQGENYHVGHEFHPEDWAGIAGWGFVQPSHGLP